jgi:hypothetical protein
MKNCQHTLFFGLLIIVILYLYYDQSFTEKFENKTNQNIPDCKNPNFNTKGTSAEGLEYCAEIDGVANGCQKVNINDNQSRFLPFGIFGAYIDSLLPNDVKKCMEQQGENLSEWGLCEDNLLNEIKGFGYEENTPRLEAIKHACQYYKKAYKHQTPKIN